MNAYFDFFNRFQLFAKKHPQLITNTLSNIFTMRLVGNKTHGDLAEIGITEFIHQYMYDYDCKHVGKDMYRAKEHEEDVVIINEMSKEEIPISLKAYGDGFLQLSTDKENLLYRKLRSYQKNVIEGSDLTDFFQGEEYKSVCAINIMPLIYREKEGECMIMVPFLERPISSVTSKIVFIDKGCRYNERSGVVEPARGRKHPIYMFLDSAGRYLCEVRYGDATANALQRGLWTNTKKVDAIHFIKLMDEWIQYEHNLTLVELIKLALNSSMYGHEQAKDCLQRDIDRLKKIW